MASYGASIGTGAAGGALTGAAAGSVIGPWGTAVGGVLGGIAGGIGGYYQAQGQQAQENALQSSQQALADERRRQYQIRMAGLQQALQMYEPYQQWASQVTGTPQAQSPFAGGTSPGSQYFTPSQTKV